MTACWRLFEMCYWVLLATALGHWYFEHFSCFCSLLLLRVFCNTQVKMKIKRLCIYPYPSGIGLGTRGTSGTSRD